MSASLDKMLDQTASTKREDLEGDEFSLVSQLSSVKCSSPFPLDPEIRTRLAIETPTELLQVFTENVDIKEGDVFVFGGIDFAVRSAASWPNFSDGFLHLVIEEAKDV